MFYIFGFILLFFYGLFNVKVKLIGSNLGVKQGLEDSYEKLKNVFENSIKFDENLKKGYEIKSENNIRKTFENLFEF